MFCTMSEIWQWLHIDVKLNNLEGHLRLLVIDVKLQFYIPYLCDVPTRKSDSV